MLNLEQVRALETRRLKKLLSLSQSYARRMQTSSVGLQMQFKGKNSSRTKELSLSDN